MSNTRRTVLKVFAGVVGLGAATFAGGMTWLAAKSREDELNYALPDVEPSASLPPTPACGDGATIAQTEGPYYTPDTPLKPSLIEPGMQGQRLAFKGRIVTTDCQPVAGAVLDVWSCDADGVYHNDDFTLRGHVFTDAEGRFEIETIRPAMYTDFGFFRTPHLHVKLQGKGTSLLTTQVYFPDEDTNAEDSIYDESLVMALSEQEDGSVVGEFDFVLERLS
ncbi:MAG: intradiol ring-cleavage dioxygenase [Pseudomonadota bacterium]